MYSVTSPPSPAAILCEGLAAPAAATVELKTEPLPYTGEPLPPHLSHDGTVPGNTSLKGLFNEMQPKFKIYLMANTKS